MSRAFQWWLMLMAIFPAASLSFPVAGHQKTKTTHFPSFSQNNSWCPTIYRRGRCFTIISCNNVDQMDEGPEEGDDKVKDLFAWISHAIKGDLRYQDFDLAIEAVFNTNLPENSTLKQMLTKALVNLPPGSEDVPCGNVLSREEQERNSLGPLGAGQWTGQTEKFPHSLLTVSDLSTVEDWTQKLPRTCRQNISKGQRAASEEQLFTISLKEIVPDAPAPHSTLSHFRCVVDHEVRLNMARYNADKKDHHDTLQAYNVFLNAMCEAMERFVISTQGSGTIMEYRDNESSRLLAFCHIVGKGKTLRGQWFYATNQATSKGYYIWFHCIKELVRMAVEDLHDIVTVVDLGPNGTDGHCHSHAKLKEKYGFVLHEDWPSVADYRGSFWSIDNQR